MIETVLSERCVQCSTRLIEDIPDDKPAFPAPPVIYCPQCGLLYRVPPRGGHDK